MRYLEVNLACRGNDKPFDLGYEGENIVTGVIFDYSSWRELYGVGALTLAVQPSGNSNPYPVTLTAIDDTHVLWTLTKTDLNEEGAGRCQLTYVVGEAIKKSAVFVYKAGYSMDATGEIPDPYISYFEQILETGAQVQADAAAAEQAKEDAETAAQDARASADEIENMTATAETLPAGSDATAEYSDGTLSLGIPQGVPGNEGPQGPPGPTGNGIQSTVLNADYTLTITFTNGSTYTTPSIRGPQGPDGETGPTGKGIKSTVLNSDYTLTITFTDDTTYTTPSIRGEQGEQGDPGVVQDVTVNGTSVLDGAIAKVVIPEITKTVTGNPIVIDDADGEVKSLNVELTPIQEGTGTPSPTNIRPISPHTSVDVRDTGVNQWDEEWENGRFNVITGAKSYGNGVRSKNKIKVVPNTTYYIMFGDYDGARSAVVLYYDANGDYVSYESKYTPTLNTSITTPSNVYYMNFNFQTSTAVTAYNNDISINYPSTDHDYHPYTGQTVTVPLNDLYGGTVDVIGGQDGKDTWGCVDLGTLTWSRLNVGTNAERFVATDIPIKVVTTSQSTINGNLLCSIYEEKPWTTLSQSGQDKFMCFNYSGGAFAIRDTTYTSVADFKAAMAGVQLCYELATPNPLTTTPTPLTLYKGDNVVSSDGDMELTYVRNLQAVITSIEDRLSGLEG